MATAMTTSSNCLSFRHLQMMHNPAAVGQRFQSICSTSGSVISSAGSPVAIALSWPQRQEAVRSVTLPPS
jgi:hypothetical protein